MKQQRQHLQTGDVTGSVFIVGAPRSGTTLLRLMINRHPDIAIPPESWFVTDLLDRFPVDRRLSPAEVDEALALVTSHERWRDWGLDPGRLRRRMARLTAPDLAAVVEAGFRQMADAAGVKRWGDKTPHYLEHIEQLSKLFPAARFVHIIRDARDVSLSYRKLGWNGAFLFRQAAYWQRTVAVGIAAGRTLPPNRYIELRYEDLVLRPARELRRVCAFIGLDFRPEMLRYSEDLDAQIPESEKVLHIHDKLAGPLRHIDVGRWRSTMRWHELLLVESMAGATMNKVQQTRHTPPLLGLPFRLVFWLPDWLATASLSLRQRHGLTKAGLRSLRRKLSLTVTPARH